MIREWAITFLLVIVFFAPVYALFVLARMKIAQRKKAVTSEKKIGIISLYIFAASLVVAMIVTAIGLLSWNPNPDTLFGLVFVSLWFLVGIFSIPLFGISWFVEWSIFNLKRLLRSKKIESFKKSVS